MFIWTCMFSISPHFWANWNPQSLNPISTKRSHRLEASGSTSWIHFRSLWEEKAEQGSLWRSCCIFPPLPPFALCTWTEPWSPLKCHKPAGHSRVLGLCAFGRSRPCRSIELPLFTLTERKASSEPRTPLAEAWFHTHFPQIPIGLAGNHILKPTNLSTWVWWKPQQKQLHFTCGSR